MNEQNKQESKYFDLICLLVGELIIAAAVLAVGCLIAGKFDYKILTGGLLGGAVTVLNHLIMTLSVNRAVNKYIELRGDKEMTEEEAEEFSKKHGMDVQNAMTMSYILRLVMMVVSLAAAFITRVFNPLATFVPLIMYRPLLYITEIIRKKRGG